MANTVTQRTIFGSGTEKRVNRSVVVQYVDTATGTITIADASTFTGPDGPDNANAVDYFSITSIQYDLSDGVSVVILFDATSDVPAITLSGQGELDFSKIGGLVDPKATGYTGDILATYAGMGAGDNIYLNFWLKKKQN